MLSSYPPPPPLPLSSCLPTFDGPFVSRPMNKFRLLQSDKGAGLKCSVLSVKKLRDDRTSLGTVCRKMFHFFDKGLVFDLYE